MADETKRKQTARLWSPSASLIEFLPEWLAGQGFAVRPQESDTLRELTLDSRDWWFHRSGVACRVRTLSGQTTLALVPLSEDRRQPTPNEDIEEPLSAPPSVFPTPMPGERLSVRLRDCMSKQKLDRRMELVGQRSRYRLMKPTKTELTMVCMKVELSSGERTDSSAEVTLTLKAGSRKQLNTLTRAMVSRLDMQPIEGSLLGHRLGRLGVELPALVEGDDLKLSPKDRFVDAAYRVLRRHFDRMLWNEPGTCLGVDLERLHDMRVATRRMRAALRVFKDGLPTGHMKGLTRNLKWLGRTLGDVRDLDVHITNLSHQAAEMTEAPLAGMELYGKHLGRRRAKARRSMLRALGTRRYADFVQGFERFLATGAPAHPKASRAEEPVSVVARDLVGRALKRVLRDGRAVKSASPDTQLHKLRIDCKRLRYVCEFFEDLYGPSALRFARRVTGIQDILGAHQDAVVARATLSNFAGRSSAPVGRKRALFIAIGHLMAYHSQRTRSARAEFFKLWKRFDRKKVRKAFLARLDKCAADAKIRSG